MARTQRFTSPSRPTPSGRIGASRPTTLLLGLLVLVGGAALGCRAQDSAAPLDPPPRFGLLADVQYADKDDAGRRRYRNALDNLERCVANLGSQELAFVAHLGDIIDGRDTLAGSRVDLERVLAVFARAGCRVRHVLGNHCLEIPREELLPRLDLTTGHESFALAGWRFLVVDALALSTCGVEPGDARHERALAWLAANMDPERTNLKPWNGGLGEAQRAWLRDELALAAANGEHAVVFSHLPVLAAASTPHHLLWDHAEVLALLDESPAFVAWFNGHDHNGGFAERNGRSYMTLPGMVEAEPGSNAYAIVSVLPDRLELSGVGGVASRTIRVPARD